MEQELNQKGAVAEPQPEEISPAVSKPTSAEDKATSERQRTEEEFRKIQSLKDKAEAQAQSVQKELQELRKANEQQRLEQRKREIEALADDPDGQDKVRMKHRLDDELRILEERRTEEEGAVQRKYDQADSLAKQYGLTLTDARELLGAKTPPEMELMAQLKAMKQEKVLASKQEEGSFKPDSGTSDAGSDSDEAFQKAWNAGDLPASKENIERAKKIINK